MSEKPSRGEIWWVDFDPTVGQEISKLRTALVISHNNIGKLKLKVVIPITEWDDKYSIVPWHVPINIDPQNGLIKKSSVDTFQIKSVSIERFNKYIGIVSNQTLKNVSEALKIVLCNNVSF